MTREGWTDRDLEYARLLCQDRIGSMGKAGWSRRHPEDLGRPGADVEFELHVWVERGEFCGSAVHWAGADPHVAFAAAQAAMERSAHFGTRPRKG